MLFVEQNPLSVISGATLPERFPEQVIIGIESNTLNFVEHSFGGNSVKSIPTRVFITLEGLFILRLKAW
jgi:hypothetical protein